MSNDYGNSSTTSNYYNNVQASTQENSPYTSKSDLDKILEDEFKLWPNL